MERTLSIIKPDATKKNLIGKIAARFEEGLTIAAMVKSTCQNVKVLRSSQ